MTATDEHVGQVLDVGGLLAQLADLTHERDDLRAALLAASDAADRASRARLDWWGDGYAAGFEAGAAVGYGQAVTDWKVTVGALTADEWKDIANRPFYAELDRKRYPARDGRPAGRAGWLIGNLGGTWTACTEYDEQASYDGGRESEQ